MAPLAGGRDEAGGEAGRDKAEWEQGDKKAGQGDDEQYTVSAHSSSTI